MVLSMTCYSAPFDHPSADSIGEKFLRVPGKGAVAVLAASWRNAPYQAMSEDVVDELTKPGAPSIGEAIQNVKRAGRHREFLEQYNLLGDPALGLAVPRLRVDLTAGHASGEAPMVTARLDAATFKGRALVDWLDAKGAVVRRRSWPSMARASARRSPRTPGRGGGTGLRLGRVSRGWTGGRGFPGRHSAVRARGKQHP